MVLTKRMSDAWMEALTNGQRKNIMALTHLSVGRGIKTFTHVNSTPFVWIRNWILFSEGCGWL